MDLIAAEPAVFDSYDSYDSFTTNSYTQPDTMRSSISSASSLLLITGATGHVGFRTLFHSLREGLKVRAAVRSENKALRLLSRLSAELGPDYTHLLQSLSFVIVPDITVDGAFDNAMQDVTHVIHVASPLLTGAAKPPIESEFADDYFITPAVRGTLSLLESADASGTVRRVVITSSIVALVPIAQMEGTEVRPANQPVRPTDRVPFTSGPYHSEFAAYANSKIAALQAAESWYADMRPAFDIIHLHPSFVLGRNGMVSTPNECMKGTNAMILGMLLGKNFGSAFAGATVHVDDVARCHVIAAAGFRTEPGCTSFILSQKSRWNDAKAVSKRLFPEAVAKKILVSSGDIGTTHIPIDASETEETFGFRFQGFDDQLYSLISQFLDLRASKQHKHIERERSRSRSRSANGTKREAMMRIMSSGGQSMHTRSIAV